MSSQSSYKSELRSTIYGVLHMIEANRTWSIPQYSNSLPALSTAPSSPLQAEAEEEPEDDPLPGRISFDSPRVANLHAHRKPPSGNQEGDVFTPRFQPLAWLEENRRQFIVRVAKLPSGQQSQVGGYEEVAKYAIVGELGKGGEGRCFLLQSCPGVEPVQKLAMKVPFKDPSMEPPGVNTLREIAVSRWLADDRVPREYKDVFPSHHLVHALNQGLQYAIFMDYMPGGALAEELWRQKSRDDRGPSPFGYLKEEVEEEVEEGRGEGCESGEGKYSLQQRVERCIELVRKVEVMHRCLSDMFGETMFNTDIKSDNILIDENGALRLADLGMVQPWRQLGAGDLRGGTWPYLPMDFLLILKNKSPGGILPSDLLFKAMPQFIAHSFGDLDMDFYIWTLGAVMLTIIHPALLMTQWHKSGGGDDLKRSMFARLRMHEDLKHYLETQLNLPLQGQSPVAERALKIIQGCFDVPGHRPSEVKLIDEFSGLLVSKPARYKLRPRSLAKPKPAPTPMPTPQFHLGRAPLALETPLIRRIRLKVSSHASSRFKPHLIPRVQPPPRIRLRVAPETCIPTKIRLIVNTDEASTKRARDDLEQRGPHAKRMRLNV